MKKQEGDYMNNCELDILKTIYQKGDLNQREIAISTGFSLGRINKGLKVLVEENYLSDNLALTGNSIEILRKSQPRSAIILAAGYGMRMVPIGSELPKALLKIDGEPLIERLINQLHEVNINDIIVVVGFMKERFEYLIDKYNVKLAINTNYALKNNLHSLSKVASCINNTYILPADIWFKHNPFSTIELYSWYMVSEENSENSNVYVNRKFELAKTNDINHNNYMVGIAYISECDCERLKQNIERLCEYNKYNHSFWEEALFDKDKMFISAKILSNDDYIEINSYEQLREIDNKSDSLRSDVIEIIEKVLDCKNEDIKNISVLKKGMTNRSFIFEVKGSKYIMRIPGEGTDKLINRQHEYDVYAAINGKKICDDPIYINPTNGYKITKYLNGVRSADCENIEDLNKCMQRLKSFHDMNLKVNHEFDLFGEIVFYENLRDGKASVYQDYDETKKNVFSLQTYVENHVERKTLTHIDAVPDNFLFYIEEGKEKIQLTDWEYAGMQDPHVDIAMFCIYSLYDRAQIDRLIDIYFNNQCSRENRIKIYCYIAIAGLLWSNWCEYKLSLGVEFGEYALRQYRYAKEYYRIAAHEMEINNE